MNVEVKCSRCGCNVAHECQSPHYNRIGAIQRLFSFKLDHVPRELLEIMKESHWYEEGDENAPFFSQSFIYPLFDKENSRTILYTLNAVLRHLGFDPRDVMFQPPSDGSLSEPLIDPEAIASTEEIEEASLRTEIVRLRAKVKHLEKVKGNYRRKVMELSQQLEELTNAA